MSIASLVISILAFLISAVGVVFAKKSSDSAKRSADAAEQSASETAKSRSDYLGSVIHIAEPTALRERWILNPYVTSLALAGPPAEAQPNHSLAYPKDSEQHILLGAFINFRNEGQLTAMVIIDSLRSEVCSDVAKYREVTSPNFIEPKTIDPFDPVIKNNLFMIGPGKSQGVIVRAGPSLQQWIDQGGDQVVNVDITASTSPDGASQRWQLILQTSILQQNVFSNSVYEVGAWALPEIQLIELPREYPDKY